MRLALAAMGMRGDSEEAGSGFGGTGDLFIFCGVSWDECAGTCGIIDSIARS